MHNDLLKMVSLRVRGLGACSGGGHLYPTIPGTPGNWLTPLPPSDTIDNVPRTHGCRGVEPPQRFDALVSVTKPTPFDMALHDYMGRHDPLCHPSDPELMPDGSLGMPLHALVGRAVESIEVDEPTTCKAAMRSPHSASWQMAMDEEMQAMMDAGVYTPVSGGRVVTSRWVSKVKRLGDGSIERFKARLVARGFQQIAGVDHDETSSPVAKYQSIRVILALAAQHDLELHQMDVVTKQVDTSLDGE